MANEGYLTVNLKANKLGANITQNYSASFSMTGNDMSQLTQEIGTTSELLTFGNITGAPQIVSIRNLDPTNYVEISDGRVTGTGSGYLINNASGYAIASTALTIDAGSGTIIAGDTITIGAYNYVVTVALAANVVTIAAPGLIAAIADNDPVTIYPYFKIKVPAGKIAVFTASSATIYAKANTAACNILIQAVEI